MKLLTGFFKLVRWPNLVFIALTQVLFQYFIIIPVKEAAGVPILFHFIDFIFLVAASVLIAAAGYIINDYFDLNIDKVNKPDKIIIERVITRRAAILWHALLSLIGLVLTAIVARHVGMWWIVLANAATVLALWFYSTKYKKTTLIGNTLISLLTAWVIIIIFFVNRDADNMVVNAKLLRLTALYSGFAFIISLIREVIKDMEDVEGDRRYGCKTMPILWGMNAAKIFTAVWLSVIIIAIAAVQFYVIQFGWWYSAAYCIIFVLLPLVWIFKQLFTANTSAHYHKLSTAVKLVMLAGILSMVFFKFYI